LIVSSNLTRNSCKKRVCMCVFNNFTHDSRVLKEASSLCDAGYEITVIALLDNKTLPFEKIGAIQVKRISASPIPIKAIAFVSNRVLGTAGSKDALIYGRHGNEQKKSKAKFVRRFIKWIRSAMINLHRSLTISYFNYRITCSVKNEKYDVVHAHDLNTLMGGYCAAKRKGAKLIYDSHELYLERNRLRPYSPFGKWVRRRVEDYLINRADHVITVNKSLSSTLADWYQIKLPTVLMNTPNLKRSTAGNGSMSLHSALSIENTYHIILYSGAITFNRGLENVIRALVYLPQCFFVLMGYGNAYYKRKLETIAAELNIDKQLAFFGPVPNDQVTLYAASADLGIAAIENVCLSYYYCSPNKLFEYLLAGIPVIASDLPELGGIITEYNVGCTFDPNSPKDIARAAMEILESPEKRINYKKNTFSVASVYNWETESKKLIKIYRSLE